MRYCLTCFLISLARLDSSQMLIWGGNAKSRPDPANVGPGADLLFAFAPQALGDFLEAAS